jgi:hypothetical protein
VLALVRAAGSEQDAAIYLVAAFTGLRRGELLAAPLDPRESSGATVGQSHARSVEPRQPA